MATMKAGIIGYDTSHAVKFAELANSAPGSKTKGIKVIAGYPSFSPDIKASFSRVDAFKAEMVEKWGVITTSSIKELVDMCDVILLESVDGRRHLQEAEPVIKAGKPLFIDKPLASNYTDSRKIVEMAGENNCPVFSSSPLRFDLNITKTKNDETLGGLLGCDAVTPSSLEISNPGLFWYGIHGVEILYTFMGEGCVKVYSEKSEDFHLVTGLWRDGRLGSVRGTRRGKPGFGATVFGEHKSVRVLSSNEIPFYSLIFKEIEEFFKTGEPPVSVEETLEIMKFMQASLLSEKTGRPVLLEEIH